MNYSCITLEHLLRLLVSLETRCSYDAQSRQRYLPRRVPPSHRDASNTPADPPPGVLVECDPSIKAIILKIDQDKHDYIVEDLDDQTLVIKESQLQSLKRRLEEVRVPQGRQGEAGMGWERRKARADTW